MRGLLGVLDGVLQSAENVLAFVHAFSRRSWEILKTWQSSTVGGGRSQPASRLFEWNQGVPSSVNGWD